MTCECKIQTGHIQSAVDMINLQLFDFEAACRENTTAHSECVHSPSQGGGFD